MDRVGDLKINVKFDPSLYILALDVHTGMDFDFASAKKLRLLLVLVNVDESCSYAHGFAAFDLVSDTVIFSFLNFEFLIRADDGQLVQRDQILLKWALINHDVWHFDRG